MQSKKAKAERFSHPDQVDHSLSIEWHHTNHTKFRIWSCYDQLGNHIWARFWSVWNHAPVWPRLWSACSHECPRFHWISFIFTIWAIYGSRTDIVCSTYDFRLSLLWAIHESRLAIVWSIYDKRLTIVWTIQDFRLTIVWVIQVYDSRLTVFQADHIWVPSWS